MLIITIIVCLGRVCFSLCVYFVSELYATVYCRYCLSNACVSVVYIQIPLCTQHIFLSQS